MLYANCFYLIIDHKSYASFVRSNVVLQFLYAIYKFRKAMLFKAKGIVLRIKKHSFFNHKNWQLRFVTIIPLKVSD